MTSRSMKSVSISHVEGAPGKVYYPLSHDISPIPQPTGSQVLVKVHAVAVSVSRPPLLNHRDHFIRQHLYPGTDFHIPLGSDCVGKVIALGNAVSDSSLLHKRVLAYPARGWATSPAAPDSPSYAVLGGTNLYPNGTFAEYILVDSPDLVAECPAHLDDVHAAAVPLAALTAYRAAVTRGEVGPGATIVVTGAGGGVAIYATQIAKALGANVFVTAGNGQKLSFAINTLGADGGVLYKEAGWGKKLRAIIKEKCGAEIDAVVDGAGGDVVAQLVGGIKPGGKIVCYGMTTGPRTEVGMAAVLKNIDFRGSTMGSKREFDEVLTLIAKAKLQPVVAQVINGLNNMEDAFTALMATDRVGKIVVTVSEESKANM
ncbi:hypothetical protein V1525DRAFT_452567 [Lipomyces kononenkoae]|uniref:Uncharacterized protein n=1 Tax=Lipomyces kononenkoae TaxID=34357 RepID=A0ACC3SV14_LIPKO